MRGYRRRQHASGERRYRGITDASELFREKVDGPDGYQHLHGSSQRAFQSNKMQSSSGLPATLKEAVDGVARLTVLLKASEAGDSADWPLREFFPGIQGFLKRLGCAGKTLGC